MKKTKPPFTESIQNSIGVYRCLRSALRAMMVNSCKLVCEFFKALKDIFFPKFNIKKPKLIKRFITKMDESCKNFIKRVK